MPRRAHDDPLRAEHDRPPVNVGNGERLGSAVAGLALALHGLRRRGSTGALLGLIGGALLYRAGTGRCPVYGVLGAGTAGATRSPVASVPHGQGIKVERTVTVRRRPDELYRFWRDLENLPRFMRHLEAVTRTGEGRSHWVARAPLGGRVEWDARIVNERENELIAWQSLEGADVPNAGSVQFRELPGERGTEVRVVLEYRPPAGKAGAALARLFGEEPEQQVKEDLGRFKQLMEAGEVATTEGQPSGRFELGPRSGGARSGGGQGVEG